MPIFGLFRRNRLENLKIQEVRDEQREQERLEQEIVRRIYRKQGRMESLRIYVRDERSVSDMELDNIANELEEIEIDVAADNQELNRVRQEKRAVRGILILLERKDRLQRDGVWQRINRMDLNEIEDSLRNLGDMDSDVAFNVERIQDALGVPASPRDIRRNMTPRHRQIVEDLKASRGGSDDC